MSKDGRTEKATPKRREEAREEGQVVRSKDFNILMTYLAFFIGVLFFQKEIANIFFRSLTTGLELVSLEAAPKQIVYSMLGVAAPLLIITALLVWFFVGMNQVIQVGFLFTGKAVKPDIKRLNPTNYFKNVGNVKKSGFEVLKNIVMFVIISYVVFSVYSNNIHKIQSVIILGWVEAITLFSQMLIEFATKLGAIYLILGIIDFVFQKYQYEESIKMKKEEVEDEQKEQQGSPEMRAEQQRARVRILERQVKKEVEEAQFVVVNPTHYSVAMRYRTSKGDGVPRVLIKGVDELALIIREIAKDNDIPIVENKKVAREIYEKVEEQDYIPEELFEVVGKIVAELYKESKITLD